MDDDALLRKSLGGFLTSLGHDVVSSRNGAEAVAMLRDVRFDLVISDVRLPGVGGLELLKMIRSESPDTEVILMTGYGEIQDAVEALKQGALEYLIKPVDLEEMRIRVERVAQRLVMRQELDRARALAPDACPIVGRSAGIVRLLSVVETIGPGDAPVLILGESGTGKELIARQVHDVSDRAAHAFVAVNCAAIPDALLEAELFGYEKGAFTGAETRRVGRFVAADGGTLFLDEVAELPAPAQAKLLRVLQDHAVTPLGTNESIQVDVRIISATHQDLAERVRQGLFREDLYYRLKVLDVRVPPLRERKDDLPLLVAHFLQRFCSSGEQPRLTRGAWAALEGYGFPGNVRELENMIHRAVVLADDEIDVRHLPSDLRTGTQEVGDAQLETTLAVALKRFERDFIQRVLWENGGKKALTAKRLGISRKSLWEKIRLYGLDDPSPRRRSGSDD